MASVPLSPASLMNTKSPEASELSPTLAMSPTTQTFTPINDIYRTPEYMCWLCRREIEATTGRGDRGSISRRALCRIITFSQSQDQNNTSSGSSSPSPVSISGIGYRLPSSTLCGGITFVVPCEQDRSLEDATNPQRQLHLNIVRDSVYCPDSQKWTFRVHADCWELVECRTEPGNIQSCVLSWCKALAALNWNSTPFTPGMARYDPPKLLLTSDPSYTGKKKNYKSNRNRNTRLGVQRLDNFEDLASEIGLQIFRGEGIPLSRLNLNLYTLPEQTSLQFSSSSGSSSSTWDIFSTLPHEILQQIILYTKTTDLLNFRLASRAVAYVSRLEALSRSFWLSRFLPGFELSFAMPVEVYRTRDIDWRGLYFFIRKALNNKEAIITEGALSRIARRKYWWERFADVSTFWDDFGSRARLEGAPFSWPPTRPSLVHTGIRTEGEEQKKPGSKGCVVVAASAQLTRDDGTQRYHSTISMTLPPSSDIAGVGVSTVRLCWQTYISGVRLFYRDDTAPKSLGYVFEHSETIVPLRERGSFRGFEARLDADAVQSLRVVYETEGGGYHHSSWAGDDDLTVGLKSQSTTTSIRRVECRNLCTLAASFDHFRMIAIGIIENSSKGYDKDCPAQASSAPSISFPISRNEKLSIAIRTDVVVLPQPRSAARMKYNHSIRRPPMRLQLVPNGVPRAPK